jgi:hypothetical protein
VTPPQSPFPSLLGRESVSSREVSAFDGIAAEELHSRAETASPLRARASRRSWSDGRHGGRCYTCGEELSAEAFAPDRSKAAGRKSICKRCDAEKSRRYYERNREKVLARMRVKREG